VAPRGKTAPAAPIARGVTTFTEALGAEIIDARRSGAKMRHCAEAAGVPWRTCAEWLERGRAWNAGDRSDIGARTYAAFAAEIDRGLPLKPGALELLSARHRPMALVTSSGHDEAHHKLRLTGLHLYFDAVVTLADVTSPKPAPQPYLLAAERLGVSPARCLAFEDSETGAEAAHRAGCTVVQVPDVGQATGRWAHHLARDLIDGAARAGLTAPAL